MLYAKGDTAKQQNVQKEKGVRPKDNAAIVLSRVLVVIIDTHLLFMV